MMMIDIISAFTLKAFPVLSEILVPVYFLNFFTPAVTIPLYSRVCQKAILLFLHNIWSSCTHYCICLSFSYPYCILLLAAKINYNRIPTNLTFQIQTPPSHSKQNSLTQSERLWLSVLVVPGNCC